MKKLLFKSLIFLVLTAAFLVPVNEQYKRTNYYRTLDHMNIFEDVPYDITMLNVGSSHGMYGIRYDAYDGTAYNFALVAQPFYYDLQILKKYNDHIADGATIIIPISHFSIAYDYEKVNDDPNNSLSHRYYRVLDRDQILHYSFVKELRYRFFPMLNAGGKLLSILSDTANDLSFVTSSKGRVSDDKIEYEANSKYKSWMEETMGSGERKDECREMNLSDLQQILDFCKSNGYTPVLVTLPITQELLTLFSEEFMAEWYEDIQSISERNSVIYLDFSHDERFMTLDYYSDSNHLNETGQLFFSQVLWANIANY